jgi:hypothetical protein
VRGYGDIRVGGDRLPALGLERLRDAVLDALLRERLWARRSADDLERVELRPVDRVVVIDRRRHGGAGQRQGAGQDAEKRNRRSLHHFSSFD